MLTCKQRDDFVATATGLGFIAFDYDQGNFHTVMVSAENGDNAADYYGEFRGGYPWINPALERLAQHYDGYWEWQNPGAIVFTD